MPPARPLPPFLLLVLLGAPAVDAALGHEVELEPEDQTRDATPGSRAEFGLTVRNTGTFSETYQLSTSTPPAGWTAALSRDNVTLAPAASTDVNLTLHVPASATPGDRADITVTAVSTADNTTTDSVRVRVNVTAPPSPEAAADLLIDSVQAQPYPPRHGDRTTFVASVRNRGGTEAANFRVRFQLDGTLPIGERVIASLAAGSSRPVESDEWTSRTGTHVVHVVADADRTMIESDESNNEIQATFDVQPPPSASLSLTADQTRIDVDIGASATVPLALANAGSSQATFHVAASSTGPAWPVTLEPASLTLAAGERRTLTLRVQVPSTAQSLDQLLLLVTATNAADPTSQAQLSLTIVAAQPTPSTDPFSAFLRTRTAATAGASAAAGLALVGLAWTMEPWRYRLLVLLHPLYARMHREEVLEHELRSRIHTHIRESPGVNYGSLKRNLEVPNGTLTHHLTVLERQELIQVQRMGARIRFYPRGHAARIPSGLSDVQYELVRLVSAQPGITQKELRGSLGLSKQLANYHVLALARSNWIRVEREGRHTRCFAIKPLT